MLFIDNQNKIKYNDEIFWRQEKCFWSNYGKIYPYIEESTPYKKMLFEIENILRIDCEPRNVWLDAGCGPGTMIELIVKSRKDIVKVIGVDFDGVMLDHASKRLSNYSFVEIKKIDLSKPLPFENSSFDCILANLVLSYIIIFNNKFVGPQALKETLKEIYRILKQNSLFIWTTPIENVNFNYVFLYSLKDVFNPLKPKNIYYGPRILSYAKKIEKKGKKGLYHFLNSKDLYEMLDTIGYEDINIKKVFANQAYLISAKKR